MRNPFVDFLRHTWPWVIVMAPIAFVALWIEVVSCNARWAGSGLESRWTLFAQCQVKTPNHGWVPADNWRNVD